MNVRAIEPREGSVVMRFDLPAERLRMKGQTVRITGLGGEVSDYLVMDVSMPDEFGAVSLSLTEPPTA